MREQLSLLVNSLNFLGIVDYAQSQFDITISVRTFSGLDNHKKAGEVIFYSLLRTLDPVECHEKLSPIFPCLDGRKSKDFRNAIFKWLNELKRTTKILGNSTVRRTVLDECVGERYEDLLYALSTHVYLSRITHHHAHDTTFPLSKEVACNPDATMTELQVHDLLQTYRLCKLRQSRQRHLSMYRAFDEQLVRRERELEKNQSVLTGEVSNQSSTQAVKEQVARIKRLTLNNTVVELIEPQPHAVEDFFITLPWSRSPRVTPGQEPPRRNLGMELHEVRKRVEELRQCVKIDLPYQKLDTVSKVEVDEIPTEAYDVPRINFKKPCYEDLKQKIMSELATLEPEYRSAMTSTDDIDKLRQLTPARIPVTSQLPRPVPRRQVKNLQEDLHRTALKNRVKILEGLDNQSFHIPETPKRTGSKEVTSTVKSINRMINLLNDSDTEVPILASPVPYRGTNRSLEKSFSLW